MPFKKTLIIGLGLIGGSFAKAIKEQNLSNKITAFDPDDESLDLAKSEGVIDAGVTELRHIEDELANFDLIVIAAPLSAYEEIFSTIAATKALTIDLGSVKNFKFKKLPTNFIPCHPIAGLENSGFEYSDSALFKDKKFIICKENAEVFDLVKKIGALPEYLESKKHDEIYALISHLPQFLSFLTKEFSPKAIMGEFLTKSFRLDNSNPEIWEDIFEMNEESLEKFYIKFFDNLEENFLKNEEDLFQTIRSVAIDNKPPEDCTWDAIEENATAILFRLIVVTSYLQIAKIKEFLPYSGNGFQDFTAISSVTGFDKEKIINLIRSNKKQLNKIFNLIS
jgi:prephenate dehydrogenase